MLKENISGKLNEIGFGNFLGYDTKYTDNNELID